MTAVGKILVFMNLLLSVATSAMIVLVFTTRTSWKAEYEKMRNVALVAEAAYKSEKLAHQNDIKSGDNQRESVDTTYRTAIKENEVLKQEKTALTDQNNDKDAKIAKADAANVILTEELKAQKVEREQLNAIAQAAKATILDLTKQVTDQKLIATTNQIEADSQRAKHERTLNRLEDVEKSLTQARNQLQRAGIDVANSSTSLLNPPATPAPRDVKGTVRAVGQGGLTVINIGSDSGLSAGNKLVVYRDDPRNPLYLGELTITRTEPKQAVGQFYPRPFARADERLPRENDVVSTSLGSR